MDDEPLALERLKRLLGSFEAIEIAGSATDPARALEWLNGEAAAEVEVLFLDIQMPGLTGFELLARLETASGESPADDMRGWSPASREDVGLRTDEVMAIERLTGCRIQGLAICPDSRPGMREVSRARAAARVASMGARR